MSVQSISGVPIFPIPGQETLPMDSKDHCLASLELVQNARSRILHSLKDKILGPSPDLNLIKNRFALERILQDVETFRYLSQFCMERYRYTPEDGGSHDTEAHQRHYKTEAHLNFLESKIIETATEKAWIKRNIVQSPELPIAKIVANFCQAHYLIPLGVIASFGTYTGLIPVENPIGTMAPAALGILTTLAVDRKSALIDSIDLGTSLIKEISKNALSLSLGALGIAGYYDKDNLLRAPYLLSLAAAIQIGSHFFGSQHRDIQPQSLKKNLADSVIQATQSYFRNGYKWGVVAGTASAALSYYFEQAPYTNVLFGVGAYAIHASFAALMNHAHNRIPT